MKSAVLRKRLKLSRSEWAQALGVSSITVKRWEDDNVDPGGLATEVMRGIGHALDDGADAAKIGRLVSLGVGSVIYYGMMNKI